MKRAAECDDTLAAGVFLGQLDGRLHGFGPRVGEAEHVDVAWGEPGQPLARLDDRVVTEDAARVHHPVELGMGGGNHGRMVVTEVHDGGAAGEVRPAVSGGVMDPHTLGAFDHQIGVEGDHGGDDVFVSADEFVQRRLLSSNGPMDRIRSLGSREQPRANADGGGRVHGHMMAYHPCPAQKRGRPPSPSGRWGAGRLGRTCPSALSVLSVFRQE